MVAERVLNARNMVTLSSVSYMGQPQHRYIASAGVAVLVGAAMVSVAPAAQGMNIITADTAQVFNLDDLRLVLGDDRFTTVYLGANILDASVKVTVVKGTHLLDLQGRHLTVGCLALNADTALTLTNTDGSGNALEDGTLTADPKTARQNCGDTGPSAISVSQGAVLSISGGTVIAGAGARAIGGPRDGGGEITVSGGDVRASATDGAGIEGGKVTISGGTVTASSEAGPAIAGGVVHVSGGRVNAASITGAGIMGGIDGETVTISGGEVLAESSTGPGILADSSSKREVVVSGGFVTARSVDGAGIGGSDSGGGGTVTIAGGSVVASSVNGSAVGRGRLETGSFGSLHIGAEGTLVLPDGARVLVPDDATIVNAGTIRGGEAGAGTLSRDPVDGGTGEVHNSGSITLPTNNVQPVAAGFVTVNNYDVRFESAFRSAPAPVRVFAPTFADGARDLPRRSWVSDLGPNGVFVTSETRLEEFAVPSAGDQVVHLYDGPDAIAVATDRNSVVTGETVVASVVGMVGETPAFDLTRSAVLTSSSGDVFDGDRVTFTTGGTHAVTASWAGLEAKADVTVTAPTPPPPPPPGPGPGPEPELEPVVPTPAQTPTRSATATQAPTPATGAAVPAQAGPAATGARADTIPATGTAPGLPVVLAALLLVLGFAARTIARRRARP
jgi:hypothetical protein